MTEPHRPRQGDAPTIFLPTDLSLDQQLLDHPLARGVPLKTKPIEEAFLVAKRTAVSGSAGFTLLAGPGTGRKSAARLIVQELSRCFSQMPVVVYTHPRLSRLHLLDRWQGLLLALGNNLLIGRPPALRDRCVRTLEDAVRVKGGQGTILFVVQNAEWLDKSMVDVLLDLRDAMRDVGQRLYFLSVASSALIGKMTKEFADPETAMEFMEIIGTPYLLRHLSTLEDFSHVLAQIDVGRLPFNAKWTWLQFYLPRAYSIGFRLEKCAEALESARSNFIRDNPGMAITTRTVFDAIRIALTYSTAKDGETLKFDETTWMDAFWEAQICVPNMLVLAKTDEQ